MDIFDFGLTNTDDDDHGNTRGSKTHSSAPRAPGSSARGKDVEQRNGTFDQVTLISAIGRTIKEHCQNIFHAVEAVSARLTQLESRTRHLENLIEDLKDSVECNRERLDGKLKQLENILGEVQIGVQFLTDKQEISEAQLQLQLVKLQLSRNNQDTNTHTSRETSSSLQSNTPAAVSSALRQVISSTAAPGLPPPLPQAAGLQVPQNMSSISSSGWPLPYNHHMYVPEFKNEQCPMPPQVQAAELQVPQNQMPSVSPSGWPLPYNNCSFSPGFKNEQCPMPSPQMLQPTPPIPIDPLSPQYPRTASRNQFSQPNLMTSASSQRFSPQSTQQSAEVPGNNTAHRHPPSLEHSSQQVYRPNYDYPPYADSQNRYGSSDSDLCYVSTNSSEFSSALPSAQVLPYALPTASPVNGGSDFGDGKNRMPVDDVVDKVTSMGFRQDTVRAIVKKLTDNGQSVDLNLVLDQIMNN